MDYPLYKNNYILNVNNIIDIVNNFKINIKKVKDIKTLENYRVLIKYKNKYYFIIYDKWSDNLELNNLTDYFSESVRIKCKVINNKSPIDYWNKNKYYLLSKKLNYIQLNNILYKHIKFCSNFRISVVITILKHFKVKKYLDISAGWGDRLLGAILSNVKYYCACDPNLDLIQSYKEIIETFVKDPKKRKNYNIISEGFEIANIPEKNYDMCFSSPPFFDQEIYSNHKDDSYKKYNNVTKWLKNFYIKSILKAYNLLKRKGRMILYIGKDIFNIINKFNEILLKYMDFHGVIYFYESKYRGMHVWRKKNDHKMSNDEIINIINLF
jgi:hypothetical protein